MLVIKGSPGVLATLQAWLILLSLHSAFRIPHDGQMAAVGVTSLPRGVPVEIDLVVEIDPFGFPDKSN